MSNKVLLLEDEINVGSTVKDRLLLEGFGLDWAQSLAQAKEYLASSNYDLAILDVQLPDGSGFDMGRFIRDRHPTTAVIFLTAAGSPEDRIHGLELGAEDYITKPFHFKELLLRVKKVLERALYTREPRNAEVRIGKGLVRFHQYQIEVEGKTHTLTHKECALLKLLYERRGQVVSRDDILNIVWSENEYPTPRTIDNFVLRLRKLLEPSPDDPSLIRSVRGVGYTLETSL